MKRDRLQVVHDILQAIAKKNGNIKPTHIMYKANLSHAMLDSYLKDLKNQEMIEEKINGRSKSYALTGKGFEFLKQYSVITGFIDSFGLE